jgi:membrane-anchored protein YejM (alkaline phosphatase superfamily)
MNKKSKSQKWFKPVRSSYLPNNWKGWLTYLPFTAYLLFSFYVGWYNVDSRVMGVLFIVPNWVAATAVMSWVAKRTS